MCGEPMLPNELGRPLSLTGQRGYGRGDVTMTVTPPYPSVCLSTQTQTKKCLISRRGRVQQPPLSSTPPGHRCRRSGCGNTGCSLSQSRSVRRRRSHPTPHNASSASRCCLRERRRLTRFDLGRRRIPSDPELRAKWLKVISRDDWTPNTTSCYSTACSRHFGSSDFKEGCKIRKLKKDAVPSIFEEYPAYLQPPKNRERSDASVKKREASAPVNTPPPKRRAVESQLESPSLPLNDLPSVDVASQELSLMDCSATELPLPLENDASERCITTTVQVDRAVQVSSLFSVSAMDKRKRRPAMKLLQEQAGHTCDASFAGVGPTVQFMDTVHRWFVLMDVSNCTQHIHQKNADCKQFESAGDERLIWLETSFLDYLADLKRSQQDENITPHCLRFFPSPLYIMNKHQCNLRIYFTAPSLIREQVSHHKHARNKLLISATDSTPGLPNAEMKNKTGQADPSPSNGSSLPYSGMAPGTGGGVSPLSVAWVDTWASLIIPSSSPVSRSALDS
ncbi:hypothetical protein HPB49_003570 [Dermacentor silvarum]|uniref:Uncharacterized protein n=1 Tax=Dermacentor silvarum TaxID=543639 RepID=A0ACB8DMH5_DERSI|nr:hypothetical protein HPB49_003570 [Dermacentor silvarum]